ATHDDIYDDPPAQENEVTETSGLHGRLIGENDVDGDKDNDNNNEEDYVMNENEDEDEDKARLRPFCWSDDENHQSQWRDKDRSQNDQHDNDDFNNPYNVRFFPGGQLDAQHNGDGHNYSQNPNLAVQEDCGVRDILEEHRHRNHPNRPPSPTRLAAAASNQQASSQCGKEEDTVDSEAQSNEQAGNNQEQGQVVYKEAASYRCAMKQLCRQLVMLHYVDVLTYAGPTIPQQKHLEVVISRQVHAVLQPNCLFLVGPPNTEVHAVLQPNCLFLVGPPNTEFSSVKGKRANISHPCIQNLILQFYYNRDNGIAKSFPDQFKDMVPDGAIALVMTCVCYILICLPWHDKC
ncbi:hypothetical protein CVT25_011080, partial [Psilocybe cyanescens]